MKNLNNELNEWDDVVNKVNEIVSYINEHDPPKAGDGVMGNQK